MAKRMTQKEIRERAAIKKQLQQEGVIPPDKPKLNRKRFVEDTKEQFLNWNSWSMHAYISLALQDMMDKRDSSGRYDKEAVGAAKVIRIAMEYEKFAREKQEKGEASFTAKELLEHINDIYNT